MLLDENLSRAFKKKLLRSPRLHLKKSSKKSRKSEVEEKVEEAGVEQSCSSVPQDKLFLTIPDAREMLTSRSAEDLSVHQQKLPDKRRDSNFLSCLPAPLYLALGITSLSDSKLYDYHSSQEFLTFLTNSARDVEEAERNNTINTALTQIKELTELVDENSQMLRVVRNAQEYNPTSEIDDVVVKNISVALQEYRATVDVMCERAKEYKNQLLLAESYLETNTAHEMKTDLTAMNRTLSWMSMLVRYQTWGASAVDDTQYHSDDDIISRHRKLDRRNCIRLRDRPKWSEGTLEDVSQIKAQTEIQTAKCINKQLNVQTPAPIISIQKSTKQTVIKSIHSSNSKKRTKSRTNEGR